MLRPRTLVARRPSPVAFLALLGALPLPALPPLPDLRAAENSKTLRPEKNRMRDQEGGCTEWGAPRRQWGSVSQAPSQSLMREGSCRLALTRRSSRPGTQETHHSEGKRQRRNDRGKSVAKEQGGRAGERGRRQGWDSASRDKLAACGWRSQAPASLSRVRHDGPDAPRALTWSSARRTCAALGGGREAGVVVAASCNRQSSPIFAQTCQSTGRVAKPPGKLADLWTKDLPPPRARLTVPAADSAACRPANHGN